MNRTSIENVLNIFPDIDYALAWKERDTVLLIEFITDLSYNTTYTIILGSAVATTGGLLEDVPFILSFTTQSKPQPPEIPTLQVITPAANTTVKPGETIKVSGSTTGLIQGAQVKVTLGNKTEYGFITANGTWWVNITAPYVPGNYILTISIGEINRSMSVTVKDEEVPEDGDAGRDDEAEDLSMLYLGIFVVILVIILFLIVIAFLMRKKKSEAAIEEDDWRDEDYYEGEYKAEDYYEGEGDLRNYEAEEYVGEAKEEEELHEEEPFEKYMASDEPANEEVWEEEEFNEEE